MMGMKDPQYRAEVEQLRQAIREGLESGHSTPWDVDKIKQEARRRREARQNADCLYEKGEQT